MEKIKHYVGRIINSVSKDLYGDIHRFLFFQDYKKRKKLSKNEYAMQLKKDYEAYTGETVRKLG